MSSRLTIRNIDESLLQWLRERGAKRGVSMEQEARDVLAASFGMPTTDGFDPMGIEIVAGSDAPYREINVD